MLTPFFQDLVESRLFKDGTSFKGKSAEQIAELTFLCFMLLEILRYEDKGDAKSYVEDTYKFKNFEAVKSSGTDLHNLISVLNNQDRYDVYINSNSSISIAPQQLRRYLLGFSGQSDHYFNRSFLIKLEGYLQVSKYKTMRRIVADWKDSTNSDKYGVLMMLKRRFSDLAINLDLWRIAKKDI